jgi:hypothetical protein
MPSKSPQRPATKKSGKSLKEKRAEKKAKHERAAHQEFIPTKKH